MDQSNCSENRHTQSKSHVTNRNIAASLEVQSGPKVTTNISHAQIIQVNKLCTAHATGQHSFFVRLDQLTSLNTAFGVAVISDDDGDDTTLLAKRLGMLESRTLDTCVRGVEEKRRRGER